MPPAFVVSSAGSIKHLRLSASPPLILFTLMF